ncbi:hypothetical protein [Nocardioides pacificus]
MARRNVFLHVGLAHAGTRFLAPTLATHADALRERGLVLPASERDAFRAAVEMRRDHHAHGLRRRDVEGAWADVCRRIFKRKATALVSHEHLAGAAPHQVSLLLDGLAGARTHVVVVVRDPLTALHEAWGEAVAAGESLSFGRFARRLLDGAGADPGGADAAQTWRAEQELVDVLHRWGQAVSRERVHVLVAPPVGADARRALWQALGEVVGFATDDLPPTAEPEEGPAGAPPPLPRDLHDALEARARHWADVLLHDGYDVRGEVADLLLEPAGSQLAGEPAEEGTENELAVEERLEITSDALARARSEAARLREENERLARRTAKLERKRRTLKRRNRELVDAGQ